MRPGSMFCAQHNPLTGNEKMEKQIHRGSDSVSGERARKLICGSVKRCPRHSFRIRWDQRTCSAASTIHRHYSLLTSIKKRRWCVGYHTLHISCLFFICNRAFAMQQLHSFKNLRISIAGTCWRKKRRIKSARILKSTQKYWCRLKCLLVLDACRQN